MSSNADTVSLTWDAPNEFREEMKLQKMYKPFSALAPFTSRSKYTSKKYLLITSPNNIPLEVQLVLICHPDPDPSMELILLNQLDDDITATVEIESNFIDWDVEDPFVDDSTVAIPHLMSAPMVAYFQDVNEQFIAARRQIALRTGKLCGQSQRPSVTVFKKRLVNIKMASKKRTVLCDIEGKHRPPYLFKLTFFLDDQFTKAARSMGAVERLMASKIEENFIIICRPGEEIVGHGQEESFRVHKEVLSCRSDVFEAMMSHGMQEASTNTLVLTDITIGALKEVLCFIYTDNVSNMEDHATELLSAGDKFLLTKMKRMAEKHLIENLKLSTVLEVVAHAYLHNSEVLVETASFFIVKHFDCIMHEPRWVEFVREQPELLIQILKKIPLCYAPLPVESKSESTSDS